MKLAALLVAFALAASPFAASSKSTSSVSHRVSTKASRPAKAAKRPKAPKVAKASKAPKVTKARRPSDYCASCERDSRGRIKRRESATQTFRHLNPCPATGKTAGGCPGYVIDHVVPLKRGGPDAPSNMQWQTKAEAKAKDRVE